LDPTSYSFAVAAEYLYYAAVAALFLAVFAATKRGRRRTFVAAFAVAQGLQLASLAATLMLVEARQGVNATRLGIYALFGALCVLSCFVTGRLAAFRWVLAALTAFPLLWIGRSLLAMSARSAPWSEMFLAQWSNLAEMAGYGALLLLETTRRPGEAAAA
jgi:hypothetical protein